MAQDPVDDLLKALDDELAGHPSPAMVARVRGAVAERASRQSWLRWTGPIGLAAVALFAVVVWRSQPGSIPEETLAEPITTMASTPAPMSVIPAAQPVRAADSHQVRATRAVRAARDTGDEVIVSPDVRLGLEQLSQGIASGQVTAASFERAPWTFEPVMITPTIIEPQIITIAVGESDNGGGAAEGNRNPLSSPPSRTGSAL